MSTFTGADLYRAFNAGDEEAVPWSAVSRDIQDLHVCAAAIVHQQHIAPLQQLARDWQSYALAREELAPNSPLFHAECEALEAELAQLKKRTTMLVGEEVKP